MLLSPVAEARTRTIRPDIFLSTMSGPASRARLRASELRARLVAELRTLQGGGDYVAVIIGGDFNFEPDSPEYRELEIESATLTRQLNELANANTIEFWTPTGGAIRNGGDALSLTYSTVDTSVATGPAALGR